MRLELRLEVRLGFSRDAKITGPNFCTFCLSYIGLNLKN